MQTQCDLGVWHRCFTQMCGYALTSGLAAYGNDDEWQQPFTNYRSQKHSRQSEPFLFAKSGSFFQLCFWYRFERFGFLRVFAIVLEIIVTSVYSILVGIYDFKLAEF